MLLGWASCRVVDRPGAPQTELRIGHVGTSRRVDDYHALSVMNALLGGLFNSRLNRLLREEQGYTYGINSVFRHAPARRPIRRADCGRDGGHGAGDRGDWLRIVRAFVEGEVEPDELSIRSRLPRRCLPAALRERVPRSRRRWPACSSSTCPTMSSTATGRGIAAVAAAGGGIQAVARRATMRGRGDVGRQADRATPRRSRRRCARPAWASQRSRRAVAGHRSDRRARPTGSRPDPGGGSTGGRAAIALAAGGAGPAWSWSAASRTTPKAMTASSSGLTRPASATRRCCAHPAARTPLARRRVAERPLPRLEAADVDLGLRYLPACRVLVIAGRSDPDRPGRGAGGGCLPWRCCGRGRPGRKHRSGCPR